MRIVTVIPRAGILEQPAKRSTSRLISVPRAALLASLFVVLAVGSRAGTVSEKASKVGDAGSWGLYVSTDERGGIRGCSAVNLGASSSPNSLFTVIVTAAEPTSMIVSLLDPYGERPGFSPAQTGHEVTFPGSRSIVGVGVRDDRGGVRFPGTIPRLTRANYATFHIVSAQGARDDVMVMISGLEEALSRIGQLCSGMATSPANASSREPATGRVRCTCKNGSSVTGSLAKGDNCRSFCVTLGSSVDWGTPTSPPDRR